MKRSVIISLIAIMILILLCTFFFFKSSSNKTIIKSDSSESTFDCGVILGSGTGTETEKCFLEKLSVCEPAKAEMLTSNFKYEIVGKDNNDCIIRKTNLMDQQYNVGEECFFKEGIYLDCKITEKVKNEQQFDKITSKDELLWTFISLEALGEDCKGDLYEAQSKCFNS